MGLRYVPRRINTTDRPWAVIDTQDRFGDGIVAGWLPDFPRAVNLAWAYNCGVWASGMAVINAALTPAALALFIADRRGDDGP